MVEVKLNASQQELVLHETFVVTRSVRSGVEPTVTGACLCVRSGAGQVVDPLCASVPLDPAEVLHHPLHRPGQVVRVGHHLVSGDAVTEFGMRILAGGSAESGPTHHSVTVLSRQQDVVEVNICNRPQSASEMLLVNRNDPNTNP